MKKGYRIISNGDSYKIQRFCSWFKGIFKFTKTYNTSYHSHDRAVEEVKSMRTIKENIKNSRAYEKERKSKPWELITTFFD